MSAEVTSTTEQPIIPASDQPAADTTASIDPNETPEAKVAREAAEAARPRRSPQERINEAVRKQREQERETAYWRGRAEARNGGKPAAAAAADEPKPKPTPDQFGDYGEYVEALTDWKADEKVRGAFAEREKTSAKATLEETRASNWTKGLDAVRAVHPDYDEVMAVSDVPIADHVQELLLDSDHGPRLAYYLDRHPDVADRLNKLSATQAAREIGRIEATFPSNTPATESTEAAEGADTTAAKPTAAAAPKPRTTSAPAPVRPAGNGRSTIVPLEKQSMDEFVATRKAQGASWARR